RPCSARSSSTTRATSPCPVMSSTSGRTASTTTWSSRRPRLTTEPRNPGGNAGVSFSRSRDTMTEPLRNLLTDVAGLRVGNADDPRIKTGTTVVVCDAPTTASVHVMGGAPGARETDLLAPEQTVQTIDAIVLSGGSAFGLDAPGAVMAALAAEGR